MSRSTANIYQPKNSPFWYFEFVHGGRRFRGSTGVTTKREAIAVAKAEKARVQLEATTTAVVTAETASLAVKDATLRYWEEVKDVRAGARDVKRDLLWIGSFFGPDKVLTEITDVDVKALIARRRRDRVRPKGSKKQLEDCPFVSPGTVNHTTIRLQALFTHAKDHWKGSDGKRVRFPDEPKWKALKLHVPRKPVRVFRDGEQDRLKANTRDDYAPFIAFAHASSRRFAYCYSLRWSEVNWTTLEIVKTGKRKPNGQEKTENLPITAGIRAILEPLRDHHPEFVFTFISKTKRHGRVKGQRYPLTYNGAMSAFRRSKAKAKIEKFGFHSFRRDRATTVYKATKDIVAVNRLLVHGDLATTMRYLGIDTDDVRMALEKTDLAQGVPIEGPHTDKSKVA